MITGDFLHRFFHLAKKFWADYGQVSPYYPAHCPVYTLFPRIYFKEPKFEKFKTFFIKIILLFYFFKNIFTIIRKFI
jgi:hypothetical protein